MNNVRGWGIVLWFTWTSVVRRLAPEEKLPKLETWGRPTRKTPEDEVSLDDVEGGGFTAPGFVTGGLAAKVLPLNLETW